MTATTAARLFLGSAASPLGEIAVLGGDRGLVALSLPGEDRQAFLRRAESHAEGGTIDGGEHPLVVRVSRELAAYFAGALRGFSVPLAPRGTPFQRDVWEAVRGVPYGETRSYGAIASALVRPHAARAVGHANGANPLPIVVPCHRLIGANGNLTGYGGGIEMKRWLIEHERRHRFAVVRP